MQVDATDDETNGSLEKEQPLREIGGQAGKGKNSSEMYQKVRLSLIARLPETHC